MVAIIIFPIKIAPKIMIAPIGPISLSPPFLGKPILNWKIWTSAGRPLPINAPFHICIWGTSLGWAVSFTLPTKKPALLFLCIGFVDSCRVYGCKSCLINRETKCGFQAPVHQATRLRTLLSLDTQALNTRIACGGGDSEIALEPSHCLPNLPRVSEEAPEVANVPLQTLTFCSLRVWMKFTRNDLSWLIVSLPWLKSSVVHSLLLQHEDRKS